MMLMQRRTLTKNSPFFFLTIGLGLTLIIILIMSWNIYWENLKHKENIIREIKQSQQLTPSIQKTTPSFQKQQQHFQQQLSFYNLDILITLIAMCLAILSLLISWFFILRTLIKWKKHITQANEHLDKQVAERTANLSKTNLLLQQEIEENKTLATALQRNQKLQAVGTLAAGIAHDYNNYLAIILAQAEFLQNNATVPTEQKAAKGIVETTKKAGHLTQQLLSFARRGKHERKTIDLNDTTSQAVEMLTPNLPEAITVQTQLEKSLWPVQADANQILQVFLNLGLNARDAMPKGGNIVIRSENVDLGQQEKLPDVNLKHKQYVRIMVEDCGPGINCEIQSEIFEPFYTTKEVGQGTGLGLAVAYGIMQQHHGLLTVTSDPNKQPGATFSLYFPT